ncbi:MAG: VWA domain-containing protein [Deltaproteobacteria bacterium]|jgi:uncharacterized protein YegL|nr:VWA domain-containing protein [Deltaproteobacteria bacterium]
MSRRLPVYLLLDVSESMIGPPLQSVEEGVRLMLRSLLKNPFALETVHVSVITFASRAETALPLTELSAAGLPPLSVRPGTALGAALRLCKDAIARDVVRTTPERKGDYRPLVFVLTDGEPTDEWRSAAAALRGMHPRPAITALGCGEEAEFGCLTEVADAAVGLEEVSREGMERLFSWVSASVAVSSRQLDASGGDQSWIVNLEKAPLQDGLRLVKYGDAPPRCARPRIFIHGVCRNTGRRYLIVYRADPFSRHYVASGTHPLPADFLKDGAAPGAPADGSLLVGSAPCPFCGNDGMVYCHVCQSSYCWDTDDPSETYTCTGCRRTFTLSSDGSFNVPGSQG